jgi:hypothetical protein
MCSHPEFSETHDSTAKHVPQALLRESPQNGRRRDARNHRLTPSGFSRVVIDGCYAYNKSISPGSGMSPSFRRAHPACCPSAAFRSPADIRED